LECARVTADVLHTLGTLVSQSPARGFELRGTVQAQPAISSGRFPARIIFDGTNIATLADASSYFVLRGLEPRIYRASVMQPGSATLKTNILVNASSTNVVLALAPSGNLVRNSNFSTQWVQTNAPDCWMKASGAWEGEIIALQPGRRYRVNADFTPGSRAEVLVRWSSEQPFAVPKPTRLPRIETRTLSADSPQFVVTASTNLALMQLTVRTKEHPTNAVRRVGVTPLAD
jgi:hypothetical protein